MISDKKREDYQIIEINKNMLIFDIEKLIQFK